MSVVLLDKDKRGVATITINRPDVNNAYNSEVIDALSEAAGECGADDQVRIVVLRGNGPHFQAGADLNWLVEIGKLGEAENYEVSRRTAQAVRDLTCFPKPTVALVHGGCFGGGTGIVSACDVVIASEDAIFSITEARWGVMAGIIIPQLNVAMGPRNVLRYAQTCERFDAATAEKLGLVHQVCPTGGLDEAAAPIIKGLLMSAPEALRQTKMRTLENAGLIFEDAYFDELVREHAAKRPSDEAVEGLKSFAEKRKPNWYPGD